VHCPRCHRHYPEEYKFCPADGEPTVEAPEASRIPSRPTLSGDALIGRRYRIEGFIGRGAIARVYLAEDIETGRPVAVKILEQGKADADARRRFLREANAVNRIGHPNIVRIHEAGLRDDGAPYLVMEFLFGEPVGTYVRREGIVARDVALPALQQAASALLAAHERGIIHRDLKPDNLFFIGEPGDPYELKVLDFGFSKTQTSQLTAAGIILGTPAYMAPEQALAEPLDARTDIYAFGMVMYNMLTGRVPFTGDDVEVLARHLFFDPTPPSSLSLSVDRRTETVIMTAIQKDPETRYPSMAELFDDLERLEQPDTPLFAQRTERSRYRPRSKIGAMVAEALGRNIGVEASFGV
jgi:eukaryotic-like serine/threonine-protein kinase